MLSKEKNCCNCCFNSCYVKCCKGERGEKGDPFTYQDFTPEQIASLKGPQGKSGVSGVNGKNGKSAYEIAVEKGYVGTETEWLESIKGETGPIGPQGPNGERGEIGPAGPQGEPFSRVYGMFTGTPLGPFNGNGMFDTTIIPVMYVRPETTPDAFILNENGTVTVNESGIYLVTSKVQVDAGYTANFFFQVNEGGARGGGSSGAYTVMNGGTATITSIFSLNAGDRVSNSISSLTPIYLTPFVDNLRTHTSVITLLKIADIPSVTLPKSDDISALLIEEPNNN